MTNLLGQTVTGLKDELTQIDAIRRAPYPFLSKSSPSWVSKIFGTRIRGNMDKVLDNGKFKLDSLELQDNDSSD